jgi:fucose 4-O-acetylase-like acetyltransferase
MAIKSMISKDLGEKDSVYESRTAGGSRLLYVDNMRVGLITLVIVGHMAITYGADIGDWYYEEEGQVGTIYLVLTTLLLGIGASFLLGLFYMIAGYFTPRPYDRKGVWNFILDRLVRLGIPLVLYATVINPLVTYWAAVHGGYQGSFPKYVSSHLPDLSTASVGPLWFVEALLIFSILYALGRVIFRTNPGVVSEQAARPVPSNLTIALFSLGLGLVTFLVRIWAPFGWWWEPIHQEPAHFPQYISLFFIGILAYRNNWFSRLETRQARLWGWVALVLVPGLPALAVAAGILEGVFDPAISGGLTWLSLVYSLWESFIGVALVVSALAWFRNRFNRQGRVLQEMSTASYAVYVLHPLLIVPLALALSGIQLNLELKFLLVAPLAVVLSFLVAYAIRQVPGVKKIL